MVAWQKIWDILSFNQSLVSRETWHLALSWINILLWPNNTFQECSTFSCKCFWYSVESWCVETIANCVVPNHKGITACVQLQKICFGLLLSSQTLQLPLSPSSFRHSLRYLSTLHIRFDGFWKILTSSTCLLDLMVASFVICYTLYSGTVNDSSNSFPADI